MVDWLYGELDPAQAERFEGYLEESEEARAQANALQRTREVLQQLPDEEPPQSISAILLHEASKRAAPEPSAEEKPGAWAWFTGLFRPIALHPAAAAIATLVVVAGVAGTLYVRHGGHNVAQPEADTTASADSVDMPRAPAAADSEEAVLYGLAGGEAHDAEGNTGLRAGLLDDKAQVELSRQVQSPPEPAATALAKSGPPAMDKDDDGRAGAMRPSPKQALKKNRSADRSERAASGGSTGKRTQSKGAAVFEPTTNAVSGADPLGGMENQSTTTRGFASAPGTVDSTDEGESTYRAYRDDPKSKRESDTRWAQGQEQLLAQAVSKKQCRDAARIANDILDRNPDYYSKRVKNSKDVKNCQWYVSNERKKRTRARAKRSKRATSVEADAMAAEPADAPAAEDRESN